MAKSFWIMQGWGAAIGLFLGVCGIFWYTPIWWCYAVALNALVVAFLEARDNRKE